MRYVMVTLGNDDVEWITPYDALKDAIWDDDEFTAWLADRDLPTALEEVSAFHRLVGNKLRRAGITDSNLTSWARRALGLTVQLKKRRQQVRALVRESQGQAFLVSTIQSFDARHPREKVTA